MNESFILYNTTSFQQCVHEMTYSLIDHLISLIQMDQIDPESDRADEAAKYEVTFIPVVISLLIVEQIVRLIQRKDLIRFHDFLANMGSSLMFVLSRSLVITGIVLLIHWIHENYRLMDMSMDSPLTWILALLCGELSLYWTHRAMHEINFLWAAHSFHHMSEDLNFSATLRATIFDLILYDIFAIPMAFFFPAQLAVFHIQLALLYQIWLHNEVVGNLGFIELIVNTPGQHRVHHGKNRFCIDKNYGTFLMLWDRIFGTYEKFSHNITIGLVNKTPQTLNTISLQFGTYKHVFEKFYQMKGFGNKLSALFKGPGWQPGKPRLGNIEEVPEYYPNAPKYAYDPRIPYWKKFYTLIHFSIILFAFMELANDSNIMYTSFKGFVGIIYITIFLTSIGLLFDCRELGPFIELARCIGYFIFEYRLIGSFKWQISKDRLTFTTSLFIIRMTHIFSIIFWLIYIINKLVQTFIKIDTTSDTETQVTNTKDIEEDGLRTDNEKHLDSRVERLLYFLAIILIITSFLFAFALNMKSCENIFIQLLLTND